MPVSPYELRAFPGAAADTSLSGEITDSALGFVVQAGTGNNYPDGTTGPFFVVIDYDTTSTEKLHCTSRTGDTFVADVRGADGTTPLGHADQAKVRACFTATDAQEANRAANVLGKITAKGDMLTGSGAAAMVKTGVGTDGSLWVADSTTPAGAGWKNSITGLALQNPLINNAILNAGSTIGGISGTEIAADHASTAALEALGAAAVAFNLANTHAGTGAIFSQSLAAGTWFISVNGTLASASTTSTAAISAGPGGVVTGTTSTSVTAPANMVTDFSLCFLAVLTASTVITVSVTAITSGATIIGANTGAPAGMTAIKVA